MEGYTHVTDAESIRPSGGGIDASVSVPIAAQQPLFVFVFAILV